MGKRWRKYYVGKYRLGQLHGEAVVCWRDKDGPHRRRLGVFTEIEGRGALDSWVRRVDIIKAEGSHIIGDIFTAYVADREKDGKLIRNFYDNWVALGPRFAGMNVMAVNADVCRDYARTRLEQGVQVGTVWTELTRLRSCLNWARKRKVIADAPYVWIPKKPESKKRVLTEEELLRLLDACIMPHTRLFVILAITTAGRAEAITQLKWTQVDFEAGTIDLRWHEAPNLLTKAARKTRAVVVMTNEARAALSEARAGALSDWVIEWDGEPIRKIRKSFQAACERAGLSGVTPHTLRHTVATWLDEEGIPMERISQLLGHRKTDTTRLIYTHSKAGVLQPAANVLDMKLKRKKSA